MIALLLLLICVPIVANRMASQVANDHVWLITGLAFGAVISPVSLGLYAAGFEIGPFGIILAIPGLLLSQFHGAPGFYIGTYAGLRDPHEVVGGATRIEIEAINGIVWGLLYAFFGLVFDKWRRSKRARPMSD
jgi:hypothetical protein